MTAKTSPRPVVDQSFTWNFEWMEKICAAVADLNRNLSNEPKPSSPQASPSSPSRSSGQKIRTSNAGETLNSQIKQRTRVIENFPTENFLLRPVTGVLIEISANREA